MKTTEENEPVWYGVSSGNGNDGVSRMFPDCYVRMSRAPAELAKVALISLMPNRYADWAKDNVTVDIDEEHEAAAMFLEGPEGETEFGAAWLIVEVFEVEGDPFHDARRACSARYDSFETFAEGVA